MKTLLVSNLYYPNIFGGAEMSVQKVAESLADCGHEVVVTTLNPKGQYEVGDVNGVRVHYLASRNIYFFGLPKKRRAVTKLLWHGLDTYNPLMAASLGRILDAERPDVVNTHNLAGFSVSAWCTVKKRRLALVHTIRDHQLLCPQGMFRKGRLCSTLCTPCRLYNWPRRRLSRIVDVVVGISHSVLNESCQYGCFPGSQKTVVYNAFEPEHSDGTQRNRWNDTLRFGYLGRLHPTKGVEVLIRSFLEVPRGKAKLLIAGRGTPEYEDHLRKLVDGNTEIQVLGFAKTSDFLSQVDVSVVPSLCPEAAGRVVLESMARRIPVIGSCRGGIAEQMGEGTGWVFDPDEPSALTRTMMRAIESRNELAAMSKLAGERIRNFSTEAMIDGYLRAFSCAIDKNAKYKEAH